jgi:hypothetical protein
MKVFIPLLLVIALITSGCSRPLPRENPMTASWQTSHCPPELDLQLFKASSGQVFEATTMDLDGERLYVPTSWLRRRGVASYQSTAPRGVRASTGGNGHLDPGPYAEAPGDIKNPLCVGVVHRVRAGKPDPRDPDFNLTLRFRFASSDSADGKPKDHGDVTYGFQTLRINYMELGNPDRLWDGSPALVYPLKPGPTVVFSPKGTSPLKAVEIPGGWFFSFPLNDHISIHFELTDEVDKVNWAKFRAKAVRIYNWLKTPPASRHNGGIITF